jgi:hypothetical protein
LALFGRRPSERVERPVIPAAENLHKNRRKTMSAVTAAFAESGHGGPISKIAPNAARAR